jgi:hypothetical protein
MGLGFSGRKGRNPAMGYTKKRDSRVNPDMREKKNSRSISSDRPRVAYRVVTVHGSPEKSLSGDVWIYPGISFLE